ncbi:hypothetical protein ES703_81553 [subsurface metagenome]
MKIYFFSYAYEVGISGDIGGFRKLWELADRLQKQGHKVRIFFPKLPKHFLIGNLSGKNKRTFYAFRFYQILSKTT